MIVKLIRNDDDGKRTLGNLYVYDGEIVEFSCVTIELPWKGNQNKVSCIPAGVYDMVKLPKSASFKYPHLWIKNVPNRDGIKVHIANYVSELLGCVAPGRTFLDLNKDGVIDVTNSGITLRALMSVLPEIVKIEIYAP